jgi:UDP-3-O-[3-hydroxymyristoyl] glucosamine N-acyltransferase
MIDPRFYKLAAPRSAAALAQGCDLQGDGARMLAVASPLARAEADAVAFFEGRTAKPIETKAGLIFVAPKYAEFCPPGATLALTAHPRAMFAAAARSLIHEREFEPGDPLIHPTAKIEAGARIGPGAIVGANAEIGAGAVIGPNAVIGPGVAIGRFCRIGPNAVIGFALLGDHVQVFAGAVIGQAGFGVAPGPNGPVDVPQFGRVILQDRVAIGANSTVDRGAFDDTIVGEDTKIDNLSQIAHNVQVGRGVVMAAYAGISGSTKIGDRVMMGGRVGVADHLTIGDGASLAAGAALMHDVPAGETWGGYLAKPFRQWMREQVWLTRAAKGSKDGGGS